MVVMKGDIEVCECVADGCCVRCALLREYCIDRVEIDRAIRTARLRLLPDFHLRPIDVMVYHGP